MGKQGDKEAVLRSSESRHKGHISAIMRSYDPDTRYEDKDCEFIMINYGVNDKFSKEQAIQFALGILELTGAIDSEKFIREGK